MTTPLYSDKDIQQSVMEELDWEPSIDSANIGVAADQGVVTLSGHVETYAQKCDAERATWRVKGVRAVVQNIDVHYLGDAPSDEEIAQHAVAQLKWDTTVPQGIHVRVSKGWITLEGDVQTQHQRTNAERCLRHLRGLRGINNLIELKPAAQAASIKPLIVEALKRSAEIEAKEIRVEVKDGTTVTLEGHVDNWAERAAVERAVWSAPGVRAVIDRLAIA
ncbi:BON domain-containing protein [Lysobacter sp. TY2-98]|uniref:BON domain-containing protein n=1 Tax=Lysobacter sp. TY2-98 TaxID=2290922 RepID=UPI000E204CAA|nr:BON domain-containing protein [Lysobacter sp. TY2-98]AXK71052.1 BON domain-containing protein [Lysobacter sp. TY2-98]